MNHIQISAPTVTDDGKKAKISVDVEISRGIQTLWYKIDSIYREYLYTDRIDPFLVAILPYCMKNGYHIHVSDKTGVSADLLYQITKVLLPVLNNAKAYDFQKIDIDAVPIYKSLKKGTGVATGISRGIDSFYTILNNLDGLFPLTDLTLFNVQSFGEFGGEAARKYFYGEVEKAEEICHDLNREYGKKLNLITVDSNIQEMMPIEIFSSGSYRDAGAIILLKQMFKLYYFAADVTLENFDFGNGIRREDPWIFYCLSTENCRIQLSGAEATRIDKAEYISRYPVTYENLRVCHQPLFYGNGNTEYASHINCTCDCEKCRYTVMDLAAVNALQKYKKVFDLNRVEEMYEDILAESVERKDLVQVHSHWRDVYLAFRQREEIDESFEEKVQAGEFNILPEEREHRIHTLADELLQRTGSRPSLAEYFIKNGWQRVAIYGMGRLGKQLYDELKDVVAYGIDRSTEIHYKGLPLKGPDDEFPPVNLVIITAVYDRKRIRILLSKKLQCKIMTLEEVLKMIGSAQ
ncbi:MAG: hypothetical protein HFI29_14055 [Lachnospiraceae bacterium]|jgi:hypothetical protein|nr:hypothetical protein [Lachnospiraceae bacterium]